MSNKIGDKTSNDATVYNNANLADLIVDGAKSPREDKDGSPQDGRATQAAGRVFAAQAEGGSSEEKSRGGVTLPPINAHRAAAATVERQAESRASSRAAVRTPAIAQAGYGVMLPPKMDINATIQDIRKVFADKNISFEAKCKTLSNYVLGASTNENQVRLIDEALNIAKEMSSDDVRRAMRQLGLIRHLYPFIPVQNRALFVPKIMEITNRLPVWAQEQILGLLLESATPADFALIKSYVGEFVINVQNEGSIKDQASVQRLNCKLKLKSEGMLKLAKKEPKREPGSTWQNLTKEERLKALSYYLKQIDKMFEKKMDSPRFSLTFSGLCGLIKKALSEKEKLAFADKAYSIASRVVDNAERTELLDEISQSCRKCRAT